MSFFLAAFYISFQFNKKSACNINVNYSKSGLPIGMQIVGDIYDDKTCFELAFLIEIMDISDISTIESFVKKYFFLFRLSNKLLKFWIDYYLIL